MENNIQKVKLFGCKGSEFYELGGYFVLQPIHTIKAFHKDDGLTNTCDGKLKNENIQKSEIEKEQDMLFNTEDYLASEKKPKKANEPFKQPICPECGKEYNHKIKRTTRYYFCYLYCDYCHHTWVQWR